LSVPELKSEQSEDFTRVAHGRFAPGTRGGPGRPPGWGNKIARKAAKQLHDEAAEILKSIIVHAKAGDPTAMKLCIDRILPTLMDQHRIETSALTMGMLQTIVMIFLAAVRAAQIEPQKVSIMQEHLSKMLPELAESLASSQVIDVSVDDVSEEAP